VNVTTARDGAVLYAPGSVSSEVEQSLVWVDEKGRETPIDAPRQSYSSLSVSPDGRQILYARNYPGKQIEILDLARGTRQQVTFEGSHTWAAWGPGPDRITFTSDHEGPMGIYSRKLDAPPDQTERLWVDTSVGPLILRSWSRDGQTLVFSARGAETRMDVWALAHGGAARPILATRFDEREAAVSPDGKWFAYQSDEHGPQQILLRSLDGAGPNLTVTTAGGLYPIWARDGGAIFFKKKKCTTACTTAVYRVRLVPSKAGFEVGKEEKLFEGAYVSQRTGGGYAWDVAPDGRFLLDKPHPEFDDKAHWDTVFATRIRVDLGGVERLMALSEKRP
jgi:Tol biopolymer transport system component